MKAVSLFTLLFLIVLPAWSQPADSYDLYVFNRNTGATERLTTIENAGEFNPAVSPTSRMIVHDVVAFDENGNFLGQDLFLTNPRTRISTPLAGGEGGNDAAWSPDGTLLAFDKAPDDPSLYTVPAGGGTATPLLPDAIDPAWSPTGTHLAFRRPSDGMIYTAPLAGGPATVVFPGGSTPAWSPNGRYIAVGGDDGDIWRVPVDGDGVPTGAPEQVTTDPAFDFQPAWAPGGRFLVFTSDRSGDPDIWATRGPGTARPFAGMPGAGDFDPTVPRNNLVVYAGPTVSPPSTPRLAVKNARSGSVNAMEGEGLALGNHPNPFNPQTTISYALPEATHVRLAVYDLLGREVALLVEGARDAGSHTAAFEASHLPSGVYLYHVQAGARSKTGRMTLLK